MKCIYVMDSQGNSYEATYPKRAKGLVKHGRARFINETTICLTCPPNLNLEESSMIQASATTPTAAEIFKELTRIREDFSHITLAMEKLEKVPTDGSADNTICIEKIAAIQKIAQEREITNQALIHFYEKMYDTVSCESTQKQ